MSEKERRPFPFVWATWISGLLSGDRKCRFQPWFKAHWKDYAKVPEDPASAARLERWKAEHADMVDARRAALEGEGWKVYVEDQNKFFVRGRTATLSGNPDLVAVRDARPAARAFALTGGIGEVAPEAAERQAFVDDCKTGRRRSSDHWQVLVYMTFLPTTHDAARGLRPAGRVSYRDGAHDIPPEAADADAERRIGSLVRMCGADFEPPKTPSASECAWCDILECDERVRGEAGPGETVDTEAF